MSVAEGDARELTAISWQFKPGRSDRPELTQCESLALSQFFAYKIRVRAALEATIVSR